MTSRRRADRRVRGAAAVLVAALAALAAMVAGPGAPTAGATQPAAPAHAVVSTASGAVVSQVRAPAAAAHAAARGLAHRHGPAPLGDLGSTLPAAVLVVLALLAGAGVTPVRRRPTGACRVRAPPAVV